MSFREALILVFVCIGSMYIYSNSFSVENSYGDFNDVVFIRNYDGDTFTVDIPNIPAILGDDINVRVLGIDTPEIKGHCIKEKQLAQETKKYVHDILSNSSKINLKNIKRDKYFRILADVETSEGDLAKLLLDKGYAVEYNGGTKLKNWCE